MLNAVGALAECLERPQGCAVVPGLPQNQWGLHLILHFFASIVTCCERAPHVCRYQLTLITSVLGGLVFGYASRLQPEGGRLEYACNCGSVYLSPER